MDPYLVYKDVYMDIVIKQKKIIVNQKKTNSILSFKDSLYGWNITDTA